MIRSKNTKNEKIDNYKKRPPVSPAGNSVLYFSSFANRSKKKKSGRLARVSQSFAAVMKSYSFAFSRMISASAASARLWARSSAVCSSDLQLFKVCAASVSSALCQRPAILSAQSFSMFDSASSTQPAKAMPI